MSDFGGSSQDIPFFELLKDENGSEEMAVDGTTPVVFRFLAPRLLELHRLMFAASDEANGGAPAGFMSLAALANGLTIAHRRPNPDDPSVMDVIDNFETGIHPIKRSSDFTNLAGVDMVETSRGTAESRFACRWTIFNAGVPLLMQKDEDLAIAVRDDLSTLTTLTTMAQGH